MRIFRQETKVEYIQVDEVTQLNVGDGIVVEIERCDLRLEYNI
jgi:hypothetical protein